MNVTNNVKKRDVAMGKKPRWCSRPDTATPVGYTHRSSRRLILMFCSAILLCSMAGTGLGDDERITRIVELHHVEVPRAITLYPKLVGNTGTVEPIPGRSAVLVHDFPEAIARFKQVLAHLDVPRGQALHIYVRKIIHRDPAELVELVSSVWQEKVGPEPRFISDDRTGQLIVVATAKSYRALDRLLRRLDKPGRDVGTGIWIEPAPDGDLPPVGNAPNTR